MESKTLIPITVGFLTLAANYGSRSSFGIFLKPFEAEFGASHGTISSILSITMLTYATLAFFTGYLIDRFGAKIVLMMGACSAFISCMIISWASSLIQITLSYGIIFGAGTVFLSQITALSLLAKLPSGVNSLSLGLVGSGPAIGSLFLAPAVGALIAYHGWRLAMQAIGGLFLGYLLITLFLLRRNGYQKVPVGQKKDINLREMMLRGRNLPLIFCSFFFIVHGDLWNFGSRSSLCH